MHFTMGRICSQPSTFCPFLRLIVPVLRIAVLVGREVADDGGVVQQLLDQIQPALSRALDYGVFHGINPATGAAVAAMATSLSDTTNSVEYVAADKPFVSLDAAGTPFADMEAIKLRMQDGYGLNAVTMEWFFDHYTPDAADRGDWRVSPLRAASLKVSSCRNLRSGVNLSSICRPSRPRSRHRRRCDAC